MANLIGAVDFKQHLEDTPSYGPIPDGNYPAIITASEMKTTKDGTGEYLELAVNIQGDEYRGRIIWDRLNLVNQSTQAMSIAHRTLNDAAIACGIDLSQPDALADSVALHNTPLIVDVGTEPARGQYPARNKIKRYHADASGAAPQTPRPQAPQPASSTGPKDVPW